MSASKQKSIPAHAVFEIDRIYDAPLTLVWAAWSEREQFETWWGPKGCTIRATRFEFRPGGFFHYAMQFENGPHTWGRFVYLDISAPQRIAWLNSFSNEGCGIARAPFDPAIPLEILNEVTLSERNGKTTVALRAWPHGAEDHERAVFEGMFASLKQGYGGTLDQLGDVLSDR